jgi:hypothetical protein
MEAVHLVAVIAKSTRGVVVPVEIAVIITIDIGEKDLIDA